MSLSDDFNRTNSGTLGSNWTDAIRGHQVETNKAISNPKTAGYSMSFWSAHRFNANQTAQISIVGGPTTIYVAPAVRCDAISGGNCYAAFFFSSSPQKAVNGSWSSLGSYSGGPPSPGDWVKIDVTGTTITVTYTGGTLFSGTDSSLTAGSAGIASYYIDSTSTPDDWIATGEVPAAVIHQINQAVNRAAVI